MLQWFRNLTGLFFRAFHLPHLISVQYQNVIANPWNLIKLRKATYIFGKETLLLWKKI